MALLFEVNLYPVGFMTLYSDKEYVAYLEELIQMVRAAKKDSEAPYMYMYHHDHGVRIIALDTPYPDNMNDSTRSQVDRMLQEYTEMP